MIVFLSTGEVSGDRYGAALALAIRAQNPHAKLIGIGGEQMAKAGVEILADLSACSTIGMVEPLRYLHRFVKVYFLTKKWLHAHRPDRVVAIDNQGFNLLILKLAKKLKLVTSYFVSPQEWLWGTEAGGHRVIGVTDLILAIFQEEASFYERLGARVLFVGHPLAELLVPTRSKDSFFRYYGIDPEKKILSIFPGSRHQELTLTAPILIESARRIAEQCSDVHVMVSVASPYFKQKIQALLHQSGLKDYTLVEERSVSLIAYTHLSLAVSGTVTLEHALLGTPCLVGYAFHWFSYGVARLFFSKKVAKIAYMSLPNLMLKRTLLPEFFQSKLTVEALTREALVYLKDAAQYQAFKQRLAEVKWVQSPGVMDRVALSILSLRKEGREDA